MATPLTLTSFRRPSRRCRAGRVDASSSSLPGYRNPQGASKAAAARHGPQMLAPHSARWKELFSGGNGQAPARLDHAASPPASRTDPEHRTAGGVTPASRLPARAEDFTRTRPAPMSPAVKPSAQPTMVRTQYLPPCLRRSEPVTPNGATGFCVPVRAVRGPLAEGFGPAVGQFRQPVAVRISF